MLKRASRIARMARRRASGVRALNRRAFAALSSPAWRASRVIPGLAQALELRLQRLDHGIRLEILLLQARGPPGVALELGPGDAQPQGDGFLMDGHGPMMPAAGG